MYARVCVCLSVCTVQREYYRGWEAAGTDVEGVCLGKERDEGEESQKGGENGESSCSPLRPKLKGRWCKKDGHPLACPVEKLLRRGLT